MQNRIPTPGQEGRVLITPENGGAAFYATVEMADNPSVVGTPWAVSTVLQDATAALYGLTSDAVPDDVFQLLVELLMDGVGAILIGTVDSNGDPVQGVVFVDGEPQFLKNSGSLFLKTSPGQHTLTVQTYFFNCTNTSQTVTVETGSITRATFVCDPIASGQIEFTESINGIAVPNSITSLDLFAAGGGGSGAGYSRSGIDTTLAAAGGGAGYTTTLLNQNLAGKLLQISIGSGGTPTPASGRVTGVAGGTTTITDQVEASTILEANGGKGGTTDYDVDSSSGVAGAAGGSGSGGCYAPNGGTTLLNAASSGSNGANGGKGNPNVSTYDGGTGQGTNTRYFGETTNTLIGGAGGGAVRNQDGTDTSSGGSPGGGKGLVGTLGANGSSPSAGGGAVVYNGNYTITPGSGANGIAVLRWP